MGFGFHEPSALTTDQYCRLVICEYCDLTRNETQIIFIARSVFVRVRIYFKYRNVGVYQINRRLRFNDCCEPRMPRDDFSFISDYPAYALVDKQRSEQYCIPMGNTLLDAYSTFEGNFTVYATAVRDCGSRYKSAYDWLHLRRNLYAVLHEYSYLLAGIVVKGGIPNRPGH